MSYAKTHIPKRFWEKTLDDYRLGRGHGSREGYDTVRAYADNLEQHREDGTGLTLCGPPGVGKTMLMCLTGQVIADKGYRVIYMPLAQYVKLSINLVSWGEWRGEEVERDWLRVREILLDIRSKVEFLLLDDVGKEHITESRYAEDEFDYLVRHRFDLALPTLMTSNLPPKEWAYKNDPVKGMTMKYGVAMESFLHEAAPIVEMDVADFRVR